MALRASGSFKALRLTPAYALTTGWPPHFPSICALLGFRSLYPDYKDFVRAVYLWQQEHGGLKADGIIGPRTWARLEPLVKAYAGELPRGQYPDWMLRINAEIVAGALRLGDSVRRKVLVALAEHTRGKHRPPPRRSPKSAEEALFDEMAQVAVQQRADPDHAIEVSAAYAAHVTPFSLRRVEVTSNMGLAAVPALMMGQVWPGVEGGIRVIVALQDSVDRRSQAMSVDVLFVVDSGRFYTQPLRGWAHDYATLLVNRASKDLAPLQTMLEVEAAFLVGALSAANGALAAANVALTLVAWAGKPSNRALMSLLVSGFGTLMALRSDLQRLAPTLYDKIADAALKRTFQELPSATAGNAKALATMVGQVIWTLGRAVITRDFAMGAEGLAVTLKWLYQVVGRTAMGAAAAAGTAVAKSTPQAGKQAGQRTRHEVIQEAKALVDAFKAVGFALQQADAESILEELRLKGPQLKPVLEQLKTVLDELMAAMVDVA